MIDLVGKSFQNLKTYCENNDFKGWDPYDGLNSKVFQKLPIIRDSSFARLAWIQFFKRSPINLRKLFLVPKDYNPKAIGLFITAYANLYQTEPKEEYRETLLKLVKIAFSLASEGYSGLCWGYSFDWQSRLTFTPKYFPTVVATSFVGTALLDAYEILGDENILNRVKTSADFIQNDLIRVKDEKGNLGFSYSPEKSNETQAPPIVYNASLLGARLLARIYHYTREPKLLEASKKAVQFCVDRQNEDGSWYYGTHTTQKWIDSFHSGFNLQCLAEYGSSTSDQSFAQSLKQGLKFYLDHFFTGEGLPKYYHNAIYPIDIHAPAQMLVTLYKVNAFDEYKCMVDKVLTWVIDNMQDKQGYFYYQININSKNRISYMRWTQAWMMYSMSYYLVHQKTSETVKSYA